MNGSALPGRFRSGTGPHPLPYDPASCSAETRELFAEIRRYLQDEPPALALPPAAFVSPELYELERRLVFGRSWVLVCHAGELPDPGDYLALTVAGDPVVVVRGHDGALRGLSAVCRHRLMPVVERGSGSADAFTCPYHLWRYGLDGRLVEAPGMEGADGFDPRTCRLPRFAVEEWQGFVFVNLEGTAEPLAAHLDAVEQDLSDYPLRDMVPVAGWSHEWAVNWKLVAQNVHENYHVEGVHPDTIARITPPGATTEVRVDSPWVTCLRAPLNEPLEAAAVRLGEERRRHMYHWIVFPYGSVQAFADALIWLSVIPLAVDRTELRGGVLLPAALVEGADREELRRQALVTPDIVNADDRRTLEAVQGGLGSRFAERGPLGPREPGVLVFLRNLAAALLPHEA